MRNMKQNHKKSPGGPIKSNLRVAAQCNFGVLKKKKKEKKQIEQCTFFVRCIPESKKLQ